MPVVLLLGKKNIEPGVFPAQRLLIQIAIDSLSFGFRYKVNHHPDEGKAGNEDCGENRNCRKASLDPIVQKIDNQIVQV